MANAIDLVVAKKALQQVQELNSLLKKSNEGIMEVSASALQMSKNIAKVKTPNDLNKQNAESANIIKKLNDQLINQEKIIAGLKKKRAKDEEREAKASIARINRERKAREAQVNKESAVRQSLARQKEREAKKSIADQKRQEIQTKILNSAYLQLSKAEALAARKLQDLIVRGRTGAQTQKQYNKELRIAQNEFNKLRARILQADKATGRWNRTGERSIGFMRNLMGAFGIVGGVTAIAMVARDIFSTTRELQSLDLALKQVTDSQEDFAKNQSFIADISERYGIEIKALTKSYTQFFVAAKDKLAGDDIRGIFDSVSKAAGIMGLSVQQQERAFLALNQMMSKGTVQAEELRGQLGEALPGAFGIMAKALGVNEKQLGKMMEQGNILAADVLPKFAKQLEVTFGIENTERVESLAASTSRLSNAWVGFIREVNSGSGGFTKFLSGSIDILSQTLAGFGLLISASKTLKAELEESFDIKRTKTLEILKENAKELGVELKFLAESEKAFAESLKNTLDIEVAANKIELERARLLGTSTNEFKDAQKAYDKSIRLQSSNNAKLSVYNDILKENTEGTSENTEVTKARLLVLNEELSLLKKNQAELSNTSSDFNDYADKIIAKEKEIQEITNKGVEKRKVSNVSLLKSEKTLLTSLKEQKEQLESFRGVLSKNNDEYKRWTELIKGTQRSIDLITDPEKAIKAGKGWQEVMAQMASGANSASTSTKELTENMKAWLNTFSDDFISKTGFDTTFAALNEEIEGFGENWMVTFNGIAEIAQETFNFLAKIENEQFNKEKEKLKQQKDLRLLYEGDTAAAKEEINRQYDLSLIELEKKQAKRQKELALFNAITDTAQAIVSELAKGGYASAIAAGVIGAAQIAIISSQEVPAFKDGVENFGGGLAIVGDGGRPEIIQTPDGKTYKTPSKDTLVDLPKGADVFKSEQDYFLKTGILGNPKTTHIGLTVDELDGVMGKYMGNMQINETHYDKNGINTYNIKNGQRIKNLNNKVNFKGYNV